MCNLIGPGCSFGCYPESRATAHHQAHPGSTSRKPRPEDCLDLHVCGAYDPAHWHQHTPSGHKNACKCLFVPLLKPCFSFPSLFRAYPSYALKQSVFSSDYTPHLYILVNNCNYLYFPDHFLTCISFPQSLLARNCHKNFLTAFISISLERVGFL